MSQESETNCNPGTEKSRQTGLIVLITLAGVLNSCGFVTAPIGLGSAEVASASLKAADFSLESGGKAATFVQQKTVAGVETSGAYLQQAWLTLRNLHLNGNGSESGNENGDVTGTPEQNQVVSQ